MSWRCAHRSDPGQPEAESERCVLHVNHKGLCLFPSDFPEEVRTIAYQRR